MNTKQIATVISNNGYDVTYNVMANAIMINGKPFGEAQKAELRNLMKDNDIEGGQRRLFDVLTVMGYERRLHPVYDYLSSLSWDGEDHIGLLSEYFVDSAPRIDYQDGTTDSVFGAFLRRFMIGAVARAHYQYELAMNENRISMATPQNTALILGGKQGLGKSYFVQWLAGSLPEYYTDSMFSPDRNDIGLKVTNTFLWELAEAGGVFGKADHNRMKWIMTANEMKFRHPYGQTAFTLSSLCNFIGTFNPEGPILKDKTGSRRWAIIPLDSVNKKYSENFNVDDLWAQSMALYHGGESWKFDEYESAARNAINAGFTEIDPVEELIEQFFIIDPENDNLKTQPVLFQEMLYAVTGRTKDNCAKTASAWMQAAGLTKRGNPLTWRGVCVKPDIMWDRFPKMSGVLPLINENIEMNADWSYDYE